jgi:hypothetical protein
MRFAAEYPDFAPVEKQVRLARAQRAVAIATMIADGITATLRGVRRLVGIADSVQLPETQPLVIKARLSV